MYEVASVNTSWVNAPASDPVFFQAHEWDTIEAATARVIPTDVEPGAREAGVVRFIDRYLSGLDHIVAAADGSGYLELSGEAARVWNSRLSTMRQTYRDGIRKLDLISRALFKMDFRELAEGQQDRALEVISGAMKPGPFDPGIGADRFTGCAPVTSDEGMSFFDALVLHTRQGFYSDPVYGGNKGRVGWKVIGFPGPATLADTNRLTFSLKHCFVLEREWSDLIPHLREKRQESSLLGESPSDEGESE